MKEIIRILKENYKNSKCELNYYDDFSLLIAVCLSAQTTDKRVNEVTDVLFKKYPDCNSLSKADLDDIENIIKPLGIYKIKAKNIIELSKKLVKDYNSKVPNIKEELIKLPGVGNKTANVLLAEYYNYPYMPVDTHIKRVSIRLGLVDKNDNVDKIEKKLTLLIPNEDLAKMHLYLLLFGRYICKAQKPLCDKCILKNYCKR